jgi:hypothetical protein
MAGDRGGTFFEADEALFVVIEFTFDAIEAGDDFSEAGGEVGAEGGKAIIYVGAEVIEAFVLNPGGDSDGGDISLNGSGRYSGGHRV